MFKSAMADGLGYVLAVSEHGVSSHALQVLVLPFKGCGYVKVWLSADGRTPA